MTGFVDDIPETPKTYGSKASGTKKEKKTFSITPFSLRNIDTYVKIHKLDNRSEGLNKILSNPLVLAEGNEDATKLYVDSLRKDLEETRKALTVKTLECNTLVDEKRMMQAEIDIHRLLVDNTPIRINSDKDFQSVVRALKTIKYVECTDDCKSQTLPDALKPGLVAMYEHAVVSIINYAKKLEEANPYAVKRVKKSRK
ncbi:hypothetical protein HNP86_001846 [Methanococcus maripaludis]|uniref:Uncharacterized protein n=1 Tax=Methanococcus maripaludis TaxID=39152 RepID=A0A7J9NWI8_METMI|nr:hypothetical protein [Methanococcus maripaludis]MBA2851687.1 hypothetical protein [Methanococcus maripaludis]